LKANGIQKLLEDKRDGALWIGTFGGGLTRYSAGRFKSYGIEDGLPGTIIDALAQDNTEICGLAPTRDWQFSETATS